MGIRPYFKDADPWHLILSPTVVGYLVARPPRIALLASRANPIWADTRRTFMFSIIPALGNDSEGPEESSARYYELFSMRQVALKVQVELAQPQDTSANIWCLISESLGDNHETPTHTFSVFRKKRKSETENYLFFLVQPNIWRSCATSNKSNKIAFP